MTRNLRSDIKVGADVREAEAGFDKLSKHAQGVAGDMDKAFGTNVSSSLGTLTQRISGAGGLTSGLSGAALAAGGVATGLGAVAAAALAATKAAFDFTAGQQQLIAQQSVLARRIGVNVEGFSELSAIAKRFGADSEDVADVLKDLSVRAIENEREYRELGLSIRGTNGEVLQGIELFQSLRSQIQNITDERQQAVAIDILASDAGVRLAEVIRLEDEAYAELAQTVRENGEVVDEYTATVNKEFTKAIREAEGAIDGLQNIIATELAQAFTPSIRDATEWAKTYREDVAEAARDAAAGIDAVIDSTLRLAEVVNDSGIIDLLATPFRVGQDIGMVLRRELLGPDIRAEALTPADTARNVAVPDSPLLPGGQEDSFRFGPLGLPSLNPGTPTGSSRGRGGRSRAAANDEETSLYSETFYAELEAMEERHQEFIEGHGDRNDELVKLDKEMAKERSAIFAELQRDMTHRAVAGALDVANAAVGTFETIVNLTAQTQAQQEGAFGVMKSIRIAESIINTASAVNATLAQGGWFAIPLAALVAAQGLANVALIATTEPGSSAGGVASGGGGGSAYTLRDAGLAGPVTRIPGDGLTQSELGAGGGTSEDGVFNATDPRAIRGQAQTINYITFEGPRDSRRARREMRELLEGAA